MKFILWRGLAWPGEARRGKARHGRVFNPQPVFRRGDGAGRGQDRSVVTILLEKILWGDPLPPPVPPDPPPEPDGGD